MTTLTLTQVDDIQTNLQRARATSNLLSIALETDNETTINPEILINVVDLISDLIQKSENIVTQAYSREKHHD